jgi:predicted nucleic acid-binding protein
MIVDTSVWIDFINNYPSAPALRLREAIESDETILIPGLVCTEILLGLKSERDATKIESLLEAFEDTPPLTRQDYTQAAAIYRHCRTKGITVRSAIDCVIAQICIQLDVPLLAKDRDFENIAKHSALRLITPS